MTLRDQHVLVTGGSSGIGLAIARRCALAGARVSLLARDPAKLASAAESIRAAAPGARVAVASADVSAEPQVLPALALLQSELGPVDVLVASAGVSMPGYFEEIPVEVFERSMAVNYLGVVYPAKALVPGMRQRRRGAVVIISSGVGLVGIFGYTPYAPTKFALRGLAESLRSELRSSGVGVTIVYPPDTQTPQLEQENATKPAETRALTAAGGTWTADAVARAAVTGLERGRFAVTPGLSMTALGAFHSVLGPLIRWGCDRIAQRARAVHGKGGPA